MMFLSSKKYLEQFRSLVESSEELSIAVAFWGEGAQKLIGMAWHGMAWHGRAGPCE